MYEVIEKWVEILKIVNINPKHYGKVAEYCERLTTYKSTDRDNTFNPLPMSLQILSKVDLNKIEFINYGQCDTWSVAISYTREQKDDLSHIGINYNDQLENSVIELMVEKINEIIDKDGSVFINLLCYDHAEFITETFPFNTRKQYYSKYLSALGVRKVKLERLLSNMRYENRKKI